jgi:hypothetical protein
MCGQWPERGPKRRVPCERGSAEPPGAAGASGTALWLGAAVLAGVVVFEPAAAATAPPAPAATAPVIPTTVSKALPLSIEILPSSYGEAIKSGLCEKSARPK